MTAPRVQIPLSTLLASYALLSLAAAAQPGPGPSSPGERVIVITGTPEEPTPVLYAAPNAALVVIFDAPLRKDAAVTIPGADVRPYPFLPNALVIMPSKPLASEGTVPLLVPMAEGTIALALSFSPTQRDATVYIVRRTSSGHPAATRKELDEALSFALMATLDPSNCPKTGVPRQVPQITSPKNAVFVCGGGALAYAYVNVVAGADCAEAHLTRGGESADVLLLRKSTKDYGPGGSCWLVMARAPRGDGRGFALELLARDGSLCGNYTVDLKP